MRQKLYTSIDQLIGICRVVKCVVRRLDNKSQFVFRFSFSEDKKHSFWLDRRMEALQKLKPKQIWMNRQNQRTMVALLFHLFIVSFALFYIVFRPHLSSVSHTARSLYFACWIHLAKAIVERKHELMFKSQEKKTIFFFFTCFWHVKMWASFETIVDLMIRSRSNDIVRFKNVENNRSREQYS